MERGGRTKEHFGYTLGPSGPRSHTSKHAAALRNLAEAGMNLEKLNLFRFSTVTEKINEYLRVSESGLFLMEKNISSK